MLLSTLLCSPMYNRCAAWAAQVAEYIFAKGLANQKAARRVQSSNLAHGRA